LGYRLPKRERAMGRGEVGERRPRADGARHHRYIIPIDPEDI
jgi:hypothetical protein